MHLENIVVDALDPQRVGPFWEAALSGERLTDEPDIFETRLALADGPVLDLCFQRVPEPPTQRSRLHLDLAGGAGPAQEVERLVRLGARHLDAGGPDLTGAVLVDPEGNPFRVLEGVASTGTGPVAALLLDSADPVRDARFWAWLTGWSTVGDDAGPAARPRSLRHPSGRGPDLRLCPEPAPKTATKSRLHLDVRLHAGQDPDDVEASIAERGGARLHRPEWGDLPWRSYLDPSGNEFCVLAAST